jgi:glycosyltransferase involved in cell wall biosynthesis
MLNESNTPNSPKNVLFVHYGDDWIRGSEVCLINLVGSLSKERFSAVIWTNNHALHNKVSGRYISYLSPFVFMANELTPESGIIQWINLIKTTITIIKEHNISVIHVNSGAPCQWMLVASYLTGTPIVTHLHSDYGIKDRLSFGLLAAPLLVTVSVAISQSLRADGVQPNRFRHIANGINQPSNNHKSLINVKQRLGISQETQLMVTVGSLIHRKGVDRLIRLVNKLTNEPVQYHLLVIGDGIERNRLEMLAHQLEVGDKIHFVGEQHDVYGWLKGGPDLFISGARNEAFGLVLAEAASACIPVIAPEVDGIPEVLKHNHSALLYKNHTTEHIAGLVKQLCSSPELQARLIRKAKSRVDSKFSITSNTRQFENLYTEILNTPKLAKPSLKTLVNPFIKVLVSQLWLSVKRRVANINLGRLSNV